MNPTIISFLPIAAILLCAFVATNWEKLLGLLASFRASSSATSTVAPAAVGVAYEVHQWVDPNPNRTASIHAFECLLEVRDRLQRSLAPEFVDQLLAPLLPHLISGAAAPVVPAQA